MNFNIITTYSLWLSIICLFVAGAYAWIFYNKDNKLNEMPRSVIYLMMSLRFIVVFTLSFLLLKPLIRTISTHIEKPIIIFAQDNSESIIQNNDSVFYRTDYLSNIQKFENAVKENFELISYSFGEKTTKSKQYSFNENYTDFSELFNNILVKQANRNVGALIIASDGIYNRGQNPIYAAPQIDFPIYTIALGDSTIKPDLVINQVKSNRIAFLGNKFPIVVNLAASRLAGKKIKLNVTENTNTLIQKDIVIDNNNFSTQIEIELNADKVGTHRFRFSVDAIDGEANTKNNTADAIIEVVDRRQKILIVTNAPHPDAGAIKNVLEMNRNFEVDFFSFDKLVAKISDYNLVILNQIPSVRNSASSLISDIYKNNIPVLFIVGNQTDLQKLNNLNAGLTIIPKGKNNDNAQARHNKNFPFFELSDDIQKFIVEAPPLTIPFGSYKTHTTSEVLFFQNINKIETEQPLVIFNPDGLATDNKTGFIVGEGLWRWRLNNYAMQNNHDLFDEIINKIVQYMSMRRQKENLVITHKKVFNENEPIIFDAEVYNESYEPAENADLQIEIINENNKSFTFKFGHDNKKGKTWRMNAGTFPEGNYQYTTTAMIGTKQYKKSGSFIVIPLNMESLRTVANHNLLFQIANETKGKFYNINQINELTDQIINNKNISAISYEEKSLKDLINMKWIFFLLLIFLSAEWFVRKFFGNY